MKRFNVSKDKGNTPTGVGKTVERVTEDRLREKHPHGRGEDKL